MSKGAAMASPVGLSLVALVRHLQEARDRLLGRGRADEATGSNPGSDAGSNPAAPAKFDTYVVVHALYAEPIVYVDDATGKIVDEDYWPC